MIINKTDKKTLRSYFDSLDKKIKENNTLVETVYVDLGVKMVRILNYSEEFTLLMNRQLNWSLRKEADHFDTTLVVWKNEVSDEELRWVFDKEYSDKLPVVMIEGATGKVDGYDREKETYYFGYGLLCPEDFVTEGHMFVRTFYNILKTPSSHLVHGACLGLEGNGILFCARGQRGKSTLTVLSLLEGFEYVSDDYLVLEQVDKKLKAYPVYSIITLSPIMYNRMFDKLEGTRFVSNNWNKSKYVINIANLHDRFRTAYPIKVCMFPEIVSDPEPSIVKCNPVEKGRAITHLVHSTVTQMLNLQDNDSVKKLMGMLNNYDFYKINLCSDIYKNVECLREFTKSIKLED
ncbi:MAG: hypothetical protein IJS02_02125 [Bacteroidales bacterium]|nr:hypothetical protein [Bacteroidales bacterium]